MTLSLMIDHEQDDYNVEVEVYGSEHELVKVLSCVRLEEDGDDPIEPEGELLAVIQEKAFDAAANILDEMEVDDAS